MICQIMPNDRNWKWLEPEVPMHWMHCMNYILWNVLLCQAGTFLSSLFVRNEVSEYTTGLSELKRIWKALSEPLPSARGGTIGSAQAVLCEPADPAYLMSVEQLIRGPPLNNCKRERNEICREMSQPVATTGKVGCLTPSKYTSGLSNTSLL